ncbi:unnamed protein product, partial [Cyprideis torosa]
MACNAEKSEPKTDMHSEPITLLLVGKTGAGKSCLGNRLLGYSVLDDRNGPFKVSPGVHSETSDVKMVDGFFFGERSKPIRVIDCPGLADSRGQDDQFASKLSDMMKEVGYVNVLLWCRNGVRMALNQLVVISNVQLNHSDMTDTLEANCTELSGMFVAPSSVLSPSANGSHADATPVHEASSASCSVSTSTTILTSTALDSRPTSISQIGDVLGDASSDPLLQANRCFLFQGNVRKILHILFSQYCSLCGEDFDAGMPKCSSAPCANTESGGVRWFAKFVFSDGSGTAEITGSSGTCVQFLSQKFLAGVLRRMLAEKVSRLFLSAELDEARTLEANADGWGAERQRVMEQACLRSQEEVIIQVRIRKDVIAKDGKLKCSVQEVIQPGERYENGTSLL